MRLQQLQAASGLAVFHRDCLSFLAAPPCSLGVGGGGDLPGNMISCQLLPLWAGCQSSPDSQGELPRRLTGRTQGKDRWGDQTQAWDRVGDNDNRSLGKREGWVGGGVKVNSGPG